MKICVKNTNAKTETFEVPETTTILSLKDLYVQKLGTGENAEELYFTYSGKILANDYSLEDYAIENNSVLYCVYSRR